MSSVFNVPLLVEPSYIEFLHSVREYINTIQFVLPWSQVLDNSPRLDSVKYEELADALTVFPDQNKLACLDSSFFSSSKILQRDGLTGVIKFLDGLVSRGLVDGIVYCDHYLLQSFSDQAPGLAASLEAIPGVNCMLDSYEKIDLRLQYINATRFRQPSKIILDRALNRDLDNMAMIVRQIRDYLPGITIELLANEGCFLHCPFKDSHDAGISIADLSGQNRTFQLNHELACVRILSEEPHRLLQSPFIRPEDVELYLCHVDSIKLCGYTLGSGFLKGLINAYVNREYKGNLLDLLDVPYWLGKRLFVDNSGLSFDFANMLSICDNRCRECGFCEELFFSIARLLPLTLADFRKGASSQTPYMA